MSCRNMSCSNTSSSSRKLSQLTQCLFICLLLLGTAGTAQSSAQAKNDLSSPHAFPLSGDYEGVHDPSIIKSGDTWYLFTTGRAPGGHMAIRCSKDLMEWKFCGQVFAEIPQWIQNDSPGTHDLWAPDISYFNGSYHLYYAYSLFGKNLSGIALATNKTLDSDSPNYMWVDEGLVLRSQETDDFNAIDANLTIDASGKVWMAFGSFWSGIKMRHIDPSTGKLSLEDTHLYSLASREHPPGIPSGTKGLPPNWQAVEAPFVVHHGHFYYLFVSWDLCCRGTKSTYRTMVGRSRKITGPFQDKTGKPMPQGGGTSFLVANNEWIGPGGASFFTTQNDAPAASTGQNSESTIMVFHAYDAKTGKPALHISTITWNHGWPKAAMEGDPSPESPQK